MADPAIVERFLAAFGAADTAAMRQLLAPDLVAWVTNADGGMDRIEGRDGRQARRERHLLDIVMSRWSRIERPTRQGYNPIVLPTISFMIGEQGRQRHVGSPESQASLQMRFFEEDDDQRA